MEEITHAAYATHTYTSLGGPFYVTVNASNVAGELFSEPFLIWIREYIDAIALSSSATTIATHVYAEFDLEIASGTDYTCMWNFGSKTIKTISDKTPVGLTRNAVQYRFETAGDYKIEVICDNGVSLQNDSITVIVFDVITNLRSNCSGALADASFVIKFEIDGDPKGVNLDVTLDEYILTMRSDEPFVTNSILEKTRGGYWLNVVATNPVSTDILRIEFLIENNFQDPFIYMSPDRLMHGADASVRVSTSGGSSLTVDIDYGDDTEIDTYYTGRFVAWPIGFELINTHAYRIPGTFYMKVIMYNGFQNYTTEYRVTVLNQVKGMDDANKISHKKAHDF